jgi:predicted phage tail protein
MKTITLHGALRQFGAKWRLDVRTPAEAIRAIMYQCPAFRAHLIKHSEPGYRVWVGGEARDPRGVCEPFSKGEVMRIVPVVRGAGGNSPFGIILGIGLIALGGAGFFTTAMAGFGAIGTGIVSAVTGIGWGLVIGGISSMLFKPPKSEVNASERPENKPSYLFSGAINTEGQGGCVPLCYGGPIIVGSARVSAGMYSQGIEA